MNPYRNNPSVQFIILLFGFLFFSACSEGTYVPIGAHEMTDSLRNSLAWPEDVELSFFSGPELTPSPACLAAAPTGEVFVGVDMIGSLGKSPEKGRIMKMLDLDQDGIADSSTVFAKLDNPRGLLPIGNKLYVLYTTFSEETGKATGMDLVVFEDLDQDGIADGAPKPLIQNISSPKFLQDRGTDHSTNGIRMGIDGWIYIAVGDFGFHDAVDREGTKMTMLGGGIVRVRPDGTEMEIYTHGLRNIYDMAIDPFMNIFTRGNTNDGGGWDIRFAHHIQSGEYGYPVLFKHFTDEILPALVDVGGGSGTGAMYMDEPTWPDSYNKVPMMADWGRNYLFFHRVIADGASFTQKHEPFLKVPQITDIDVDGSGRMYLSAWDGAGYRGNPNIGFVLRATPKNWTYSPFPRVSQRSENELQMLLSSESATARLYAQQELLLRDPTLAAAVSKQVVQNKKLSLEARIAGMYAYSQIKKEKAIPYLVKLSEEPKMKEHALRALADRIKWVDQVPLAPFVLAMKDIDPRVQVAAMIGMGRLGKSEAATYLLQVPVPGSATAPAKDTEGLHASPNSEIIPAHIAVRALVKLQAAEACVDAIGTEANALALWALRYMHSRTAVNGLIAAYEKTEDISQKEKILTTLSRIYHKEAPYDGSWWWSTRPDTHGPYYKTITWGESERIASFLMQEFEKGDNTKQNLIADLNGRHRMNIDAFGIEDENLGDEKNTINLGRIANKKGQVERAPIEDIMLAIADLEGDPIKGRELFTNQGCVACHSLDKDETMKGPFMGQVGAILTRDQIAESILKPNASISQGFASVLIKTKGNKSYAGFVSEESATTLTLRNIAGHVFRIKTADIIDRQELEHSMMPKGLANPLSFEEFADLVDFLVGQKG